MSIAISAQTGQLIVKMGFGVILALIAWTVVASFVFFFGTGLLHDFPHPFWQWWLYALNFDGNPRVALWLKIGAGVGRGAAGADDRGTDLSRPASGGPKAPPAAVWWDRQVAAGGDR